MTTNERPVMRYRELIARITEVTRVLVARGGYGKFEKGFTKFHTGSLLPDVLAPGLVLVIAEGAAKSSYNIVDIDQEEGVLLLAKEPVFSEGFFKWEIYAPGISGTDVRRVLSAFPQVIMECEEGEQVRTELGTFRMTRRKRRRVKLQDRWTVSDERLIARIRPGKKLQREIEEVPSELPISTTEGSEEDPPS